MAAFHDQASSPHLASEAPPALRAVRLLVSHSTGSTIDVLARILAQALAVRLQQPLRIENRPEATGLQAAQALRGALPDGNTLLLTNEHIPAVLPHLPQARQAAIDTLTPIAQVSNHGTLALAAHPATGLTRLEDLPAWAQRRREPLVFGIVTHGTLPDFVVRLLGQHLGTAAVAVPYHEGLRLSAELSTGQIALGLCTTSELRLGALTQRIRLLATSGITRQPEFPAVPTFAESGIRQLDASNLLGLYGPPGLPTAQVLTLADAVRDSLLTPAVQAQIRAQGLRVEYADAQTLATGMAERSQMWRPLLQAPPVTSASLRPAPSLVQA